jgi:hypothetical protein
MSAVAAVSSLVISVSACSLLASGMIPIGPGGAVASPSSVCGDPPTVPVPAPPIIDMLLAGGSFVGDAVASGQLGNNASILLIPAAVFTLSALYGFGVVGHCASLAHAYRSKPVDCAEVTARADLLRRLGGGTIRDATFLRNPNVQRCLAQPPPQAAPSAAEPEPTAALDAGAPPMPPEPDAVSADASEARGP